MNPSAPDSVAIRLPERLWQPRYVDGDPSRLYVLRVLSSVGIVWDLKLPPKAVVRNEHRLGSRIVSRAATQLAASFRPECLAVAIGASLRGATLATLREQVIATQQRAANVLANLHLPHLLTRYEICGRAMAMSAETTSMDDIVDMAPILILDAIRARLLLPENRMSTS